MSLRVIVVAGVVILAMLAAPGFITGAWWARLLQHLADWRGHRAKMRTARSAYWNSLFRPVGVVIAIALVIATLVIFAGGKQQ